MSLEDRLFEQRYRKIPEIENLGFASYPRKFAFSHTLSQIREGYESKDGEQLESEKTQVSVCGRLMTVRRQGKAGFCHIQQGGERMQLYVAMTLLGRTLSSCIRSWMRATSSAPMATCSAPGLAS